MRDRGTAKDSPGARYVLQRATERGPSARRKKGVLPGDDDDAYPRDKDLGFGLPASGVELSTPDDADAA